MNATTLYLEHFRLEKAPFGLSPQPNFFFGGAERESSLRALTHFAYHGEGVALITGEVGVGKTMLLTMLMEQCKEPSRAKENLKPILINRLMMHRNDVIEAIAKQLGIEERQDGSATQWQSAIEQQMINLYAQGARCLILIDEAHTLPSESLEWLRMLTNLETASGKLLQLILFAQPEILPRLAGDELRALADRITLHITLRYFDVAECRSYINHRLHHAGNRMGDLFSADAVANLAQASLGLTRRLHILADKALLAAYVEGASRVEWAHVVRAIAEHQSIRDSLSDRSVNAKNERSTLSGEGKIGRRSRTSQIVWGGVAILGFSLIGGWFFWQNQYLFPMPSPAQTTNVPNKVEGAKRIVPKADPIKNTATPSALNALRNLPVKGIHPGVIFEWEHASAEHQQQLLEGAHLLSQILRESPNSAFVRLANVPIRDDASSAKLARAWQIGVEERLAESAHDFNQGQSVPLLSYRFYQNQQWFWRLIAVGYTDIRFAYTDVTKWQKLMQEIIPQQSVRARPIATLKDTQ